MDSEMYSLIHRAEVRNFDRKMSVSIRSFGTLPVVAIIVQKNIKRKFKLLAGLSEIVRLELRWEVNEKRDWGTA